MGVFVGIAEMTAAVAAAAAAEGTLAVPKEKGRGG